MKKFFENFTDKKFLMAFVAVVTGILTLYNIEDNTISLVTSLILIVLPVIGYVISEGVLDWSKINMAITEILRIIDDYIQSEKEEKENKTDTEEIEEETPSVDKLLNDDEDNTNNGKDKQDDSKDDKKNKENEEKE